MQNGQISADYTTVTWKLKDGVTWSDGTPFTAEDVKFTYEWITNPKNGSTSISTYSDIKAVEAVDATTAKITFKAPAAAWFLPFVGDSGVLPKHLVSKCSAADTCEFNLKPSARGRTWWRISAPATACSTRRTRNSAKRMRRTSPPWR